jgi:hypothetical protein
MRTEELLREALRAKAAEATTGLTFEEIRRNGAAWRRAGRRTALVAAAAVVVAVGAPTAFLLRPGDETPSPTRQPTSSANPAPTRAAGFAGVPRGADPRVPYLHDGVVHEPDSSTLRLPTDDVTQFTPYHGGWLTVSSTGAITEWDSTGTTQWVMDGENVLAVSADQLQTAYSVPGEIHVGIGTGMGNGEATYPVGNARLVGFIADGVVVTGGERGHVGYIDHGTRHVVPNLSEADASASGSDLIGGLAPDGLSGRVVDLAGHVMWTSDWQPRAFSPDGRFVAAVHGADGAAAGLAILDARTGDVVSQVLLGARGLAQVGRPVWEESDGAVLMQVQSETHQAVLRLRRDGTIALASDVEPSATLPMWFFGTTP